MTGLGLGITASIKWVGLFTIAWVGALTLVQLWVLLGDNKNVTMTVLTKHFLARVFCLIIIPLTFYLGMFAIHFLCLVNPGDGDGFMSSEFQATLNSKGMQDVPADVLMGSRVSIRHVNTQGGYLHSHALMYPTGSKQQQITLYPHKDENNMWVLENQTQPLGIDGQPINGTNAWDSTKHFITDGSILRLYHTPTHRRLHSHDVRPPITEAEWQNEVSAYGYEGFEGDANDYFRVEIVKKNSKGAVAKERVRTIETQFRLVHTMTGCVLFSHKVKLPDWASEQQEVTCARGGSMPNSLWYVEQNEHPLLGADAEKVNYRKPGFLGKFLELHAVMWKTNAGLTDSHAWESRPESWPIMKRGINFWGKNHTQIYLIGNPIVWWSATATILIWAAFKGIAILRWQRSCNDYSQNVVKRYDYEVGTYVLGWALHYFPFFLMKRQLFLHHYFPALYFGVIAFTQTFDYLTVRVPAMFVKDKARAPLSLNRVGAVALLGLSIASFVLYAPLAYGNSWTQAECKRVKLFDSWDWDCNTFLNSYAEYSVATFTTTTSSEAVETPVAQAEGGKIVDRKEEVVYRDQDGNILDAAQVEELKGKVRFETKYETKTRVLDAEGSEVPAPPEGWEGNIPAGHRGVAPPHPDVEGANKETVKGDPTQKAPDSAAASRDGEKEAEQAKAKPASDGKDATAKDEL